MPKELSPRPDFLAESLPDPVLRDLLVDLGAPPETPMRSATSPAEWLAHAGTRAEWILWGKAKPPQPTGVCPAHPLLCHLADVAAVAAIMLTKTMPTALRRQLLTLEGLTESEALRFVVFVVALHDLGKATPAFQAYVDWARARLPPLGFDLDAKNNTHHSTAGVLPSASALEALGVSKPVARTLARAVTAHHGEFPTDASLVKQRNPAPREIGAGPRWAEARANVVRDLRALFRVERGPTGKALPHSYAVLLAGLTAVADWIGSNSDVFAYTAPPDSLPAYWPTALDRAHRALDVVGMRPVRARAVSGFSTLFPSYAPWPLHLEAERLAAGLSSPSLVIVEAPMGEGKTEASLLLANAAAARLGCDGLYVGLPTQATANQMFGRVCRFLETTRPGEPHNLMLAHGEASLVPAFQAIRGIYGATHDGDVRAEAWFLSKKRGLLAQHAVGTIDQALLGVMQVAHGFVRVFGLAGKTIILDEVHAYDTYTGMLMERLVEWLAATGTTVVLLSATLPSSRRAALVSAYQRGAGLPTSAAPASPYPRVTDVSSSGTHSARFKPRGVSVAVALDRQSDDIRSAAALAAAAARGGGCVGWICNTVARAQTAYEEIRKLDPKIDLLLLHSRLLPNERLKREQHLESWLGPESRATSRPERCVVIGTQVLEQSLDIDFDRLFTDVAPVDLVLQRAGRLHRHVRTRRSPHHLSPKLTVLRPDGDPLAVTLEDVAVVYAELLVRRTLQALEHRDHITLPDDIESLVESVYSDAIPPPDDELYGPFIDHHGGKAAARSEAEQRLLPHATVEDDPFGDFKVFMEEDDDPSLHASLRAVTRLGPPSLDIVCLERRGSDVLIGDGDDRPLDLEAAMDWSLTNRLVRRSIGVTNPRLVRALISDPGARPVSWGGSALLRHRRYVVFESGRAMVGGVCLRLDPELGLCIDREPTKEPSCADFARCDHPLRRDVITWIAAL